ncbi:pantoate--beta-alanine ligase [bacterium]|nr:pantoate--beta-alanine ligase [bacterium]
MKIINTVKAMQQEADSLRMAGKRIGLVPTMGALHDGHLSLLTMAKEKSDIVVVSIFVNPTQFGPDEDLDAYPRDFDRDERLLIRAGADIIYYPAVDEMYPTSYHTYVTVDTLTEKLCGASRPGHFRGVTTIVTKLFNAVKPHCAVFGEKDFQQVAVIRRMAVDLNMDVEIITAPIVREKDSLAMSSRNNYLSIEERQDALILYNSLEKARKLIREGMRDVDKISKAIEALILEKDNVSIDYINLIHPGTLEDIQHIEDSVQIVLAVFVGKIRLIDNLRVDL